MPLADGEKTTKGGFLLGTTLEQYQLYIQHNQVWVLEDTALSEAVGFSIIIKDEWLRKGDIWQKRHQIDWKGFELDDFLNKKLCYYEQLAVYPEKRYRRYAVSLALVNLLEAFEQHDALFTTIVYRPIHNKAALPYILRAGGRMVGRIDEVYPAIGQIESEIYFVEKKRLGERAKFDFPNRYKRMMEGIRRIKIP